MALESSSILLVNQYDYYLCNEFNMAMLLNCSNFELSTERLIIQTKHNLIFFIIALRLYFVLWTQPTFSFLKFISFAFRLLTKVAIISFLCSKVYFEKLNKIIKNCKMNLCPFYSIDINNYYYITFTVYIFSRNWNKWFVLYEYYSLCVCSFDPVVNFSASLK